VLIQTRSQNFCMESFEMINQVFLINVGYNGNLTFFFDELPTGVQISTFKV
jgi:hypothetical protein